MSEKDPEVGLIWFDRVATSMSRHGDPDTGDAKFIGRFRASNECNRSSNLYLVAAS